MIISAEDRDSEPYREAGRNRSSVESLMYTLKYVYGFGNLRRRGIDAVRIELLEKAIVHNLSRLLKHFWSIQHQSSERHMGEFVHFEIFTS